MERAKWYHGFGGHKVAKPTTMHHMKGRTGFALGVAAGYALATRARWQRPEPVSEATTRARSTEPVEIPLESSAASRSKVQQLIGDGLRASSRLLREG